MPTQAIQFPPHDDPTAVARKNDHLELAFRSRVAAGELDARFYYEPLLAAHPEDNQDSLATQFFGKKLRTPMWVSSMTGGTGRAQKINQNLARACAEFGMGMGLGSCRALLFSDEHLADFDFRETLGEQPFFANLGVAQIERLLEKKETWRIAALVERLRADGIIVHVNPLQEALQPEGDRFQKPPLETIERLLDGQSIPLIVKEVGQGFGPASLRELLRLPLVAVEFAAAGGTNFALLELLRNDPAELAIFEKLANVGHSAAEMLGWFSDGSLGDWQASCRVENLILSGGVSDFLDGYFLLKKSPLPAVFGQASAFLKHAQGDYLSLHDFVAAQVRGLELANAFLRVR